VGRTTARERASDRGSERGGRRPSGVSERCPDENKRRRGVKVVVHVTLVSVLRESLASDVLIVALSF
jgi:hypothetical protein